MRMTEGSDEEMGDDWKHKLKHLINPEDRLQNF